MKRIGVSHYASGAALTLVVLLLAASPGLMAADGSSDCLACHENLGKAFETTIHGRIQDFEVLGGTTGCVTCHGDGAEHMDSGDLTGLVTFRDMSPEAVADVCQDCHRSASLHDWQGGAHSMSGVGCADCHSVHGDKSHGAEEGTVCLTCHADVQAQFSYPSHHPVREGHMDCQSCHDPHGSSIGMIKTDERPEDLCKSCHAEQEGPFMFEHEPVNEGCVTCHNPHGAVADNLLVQTEPFICLQCHEMHFHAGLEAFPDSEVYIPRFDPANGASDGVTYPGGMVPNPWGESGYKRAYTTKCTQCHSAIHGTDLPSQTLPGGGDALMR